MPTATGHVAIFWDYENCCPSSSASGYDVASSITKVAQKFGNIRLFKAYMQLPEQSTQRALHFRSELQSSGVSLTDCPHIGRKDVADKMMIVDMMAYALDNSAPCTLVIISGDRDFAYAVSILKLRGYQVVIISSQCPAPYLSLTAQPTVCLDWKKDILNSISTDPLPSASITKRPIDVPRQRRSLERSADPYSPFSASAIAAYPSSKKLIPKRDHFSGLFFKRLPVTSKPTPRPSRIERPRSENAPPNAPPKIEVGKGVGGDLSIHTAPLSPHAGRHNTAPSTPQAKLGECSPVTKKAGHSISIPTECSETCRPAETKMATPGSDLCIPKSVPNETIQQKHPSTIETSNSSTNADVDRNCSILVDEPLPLPTIGTEGLQSDATKCVVGDSAVITLPEIQVPDTSPVAYGEIQTAACSPTPSQPEVMSPGPPSPETAACSPTPSQPEAMPPGPLSPETTGIPPQFVPLARCLETRRLRESSKPPLFSVAGDLARQSKTLYQQAGVKNFKQYCFLALEAGVIHLGSSSNPWVSLHPDWHGRVP